MQIILIALIILCLVGVSKALSMLIQQKKQNKERKKMIEEFEKKHPGKV